MPNTKELRRKRHSVYSLRYHFVWIPLYFFAGIALICAVITLLHTIGLI